MLAIGIAIFLFSIRQVNLNQLLHAFTHLNLFWLLIGLLCMFLYFGLEAIITKILVEDNGDKLPWRDAIRIPLIEQLFNGVTPFSSGGQPAQLVALMQSGIEGGRASSVLLMKFVVFQGMVVINFIFSLLIGFQYIQEKLHFLSIFVVFGFFLHLFVIVALLLVMYWHNLTEKIVTLLFMPLKFFVKKEKIVSWQKNAHLKIDSFYRESLRMKSNFRLLIKISIITIVQLLFYYLVPYFILLALGIDGANIIMVTCLHVLIFMIISLFPIPGGAGGAEYGFSILFKQFVSSSSKLVLAMLIWRLLTYYLGMLLGVVASFIRPRKIKRDE